MECLQQQTQYAKNLLTSQTSLAGTDTRITPSCKVHSASLKGEAQLMPYKGTGIAYFEVQDLHVLTKACDTSVVHSLSCSIL